jgi:biotin carboxyl carrier protein
VAPGEVIGLIEVMKNFFEVKAEVSGRIVYFFVKDGQEIMAGQPLAEIETAP